MSKQVHKQLKLLDECLESIRAGEATLEDCLRQLPSDAQHLAPMLALAVEAQDHLAPDAPRSGFVAASRERILSKINSRLQQNTRRDTRAPRTWRWRPAQAFIGIMIAIAILATSAGVVQAANAALPGDALYGLKRGIERARLAISWSASGDMRLLAQFADTRLAELEPLLAAKRPGDLELALGGFEESLAGLTALACETDPGFEPGSLEHILDRLAHHQEVLARVIEDAPAQAQPALERALERSIHSQEVIQQMCQGGNPGDKHPGQQRTPPGQQRTPPGQERTPPGQVATPTPTQTATPTQTPPTPTPTEALTIHVRDLDIKIIGNREASVTITIATESDANVEGATVIGTWTAIGPDAEFSCVTTGSGKCAVSSGILSSAEQTTFRVTNITHPSLIYAPGDNSDPDGDSDGTTITIELPD